VVLDELEVFFAAVFDLLVRVDWVAFDLVPDFEALDLEPSAWVVTSAESAALGLALALEAAVLLVAAELAVDVLVDELFLVDVFFCDTALDVDRGVDFGGLLAVGLD